MADIKPLLALCRKLENIHDNFDLYDDWHELPANRDRNFFELETYEVFVAEMRQALKAAQLAYKAACAADKGRLPRRARLTPIQKIQNRRRRKFAGAIERSPT
jgi:hypothetical protein